MNLSLFAAFFAAIFSFAAAGPAFAARSGDLIGTKTSFTTRDGVRIACLFRSPSVPGKRTFVLLHGLGSNQEEWQPFISMLVREGYGFLSYDARGHGESTTRENGVKIRYENFGTPGPGSMWEKMVPDLDDAVQYLAREKKIPASKVILAGASMGANICLIYGTRNTAVPAVLALSPGLNYVGLGTESVVPGYSKRPVAIAVSPADTYSYQSSMILFKKIEGNGKAALFPDNEGHGVQMLAGRLDRDLLKWVRNAK